MINIIIVEDNIQFNEHYQNVVAKVERQIKVDIKIYSFLDYNKDFQKIMNSNIENKIYIFDIEASSDTGINVTRQIRKNDKKSLIIFITAYFNKYMQEMISQSLLYLKYINKGSNYCNILENTLIKAITEIDMEHIIFIETSAINYYINVDDILYIYTYNRINYIVTNYLQISCRRTIKSFIDTLPSNFELSHRACVVNLKKIDYIDKKNKIIYLKNGQTVDLVSKQNMKNIVDKLNKISLK